LALVSLGLLVVGGVSYPVVLVPAVFAGILWSNAGLFEPVELGVRITLGKLSMAAALAVWTVHAALYERPLFARTSLTAPMLAVLVVMVASLGWAERIRNEHGVSEIIGYAMLVVMFHWVATVLDPRSLPVVLRAIALIVVPIMAWTLWTTPDMAWWEEYERAEGVYDNANNWCAILLLVCPMLMAFLVEDDRWSAPFLLAAVAVLLPLNIVASLSRAGFLAYMGSLPFQLWLLWRRKWWVLAGLAFVVLATPSFIDVDRVIVRYQTLVDPDLQEVDGSLTERGIALRAAIQLFFEHPLRGVGVGMYMPAAIESTSGLMSLKEPHNTYAWIAAEQGLLGLSVHAWLFVRIARLAWRNVRESSAGLWKGLSIGFLTSMISIAILGNASGYMTFPVLYLVLGLGLVIGAAADRALPLRSDAPAPGP
jgi:hypothetical protein